MKKTFLTFSLLSMLMVLTSFTTPGNRSDLDPKYTSESIAILLPLSYVKYDLEPGGHSPSLPRKVDVAELPFNEFEVEPGGGTPSTPRKVD